jgi:hypothetical protein
MSGILRIVLIIAVIVAAVIGASFFVLPKTASSSETISVDRPAANVLAYLASAPAGTAVGEGVTQTVTSSNAEQVVATLTYADGQTATATYTVRPAEGGTGSVVEVQVEQPLGENPITRLQGLGGGKTGPLLEGIQAAVTAETASIPTFDFSGLAYDIVTVPARPMMFFGSETTQEPAEIKAGVAQSLDLIEPALRRFNLTSAGRPIAVETNWDPATNIYAFRAGVPFTGSAPTAGLGLLRVGETPSGQAIRVAFTGAEADIIPVYDRIESMISAARLQKGSSFEVYLDDPRQAGGSANREIYVLVTGDTTLLSTLFPTTAGRAQLGVDGAPIAPAAAPEATPAPAATDTAAVPAPATTAPASTAPAATTPATAPAEPAGTRRGGAGGG